MASYHPFLIGCDDFTRLCRAWYWFLVDSNPEHPDYWRSQIEQAELDFLDTLPPVPPHAPDHVKASRQTARRDLVRNAMLTAFRTADMRPHRGKVFIP